MGGLIEVCVGWFLGITSSYLFRLYDRNDKINNFINGMQTELLEMLPRLVGNVCQIKKELGQFDHDLLLWVKSISSKVNTNLLPHQDIWLNELLKYPQDYFLNYSKNMAAQQTNLRLRFKPFYLQYIDKNIDILPLIDVTLQKILIEVMSKLILVNEEIDHYQFYFEKSFNIDSNTINREIINMNMDISYKFISDFIVKIIDKIIYLLELIDELKIKKPSYRLKSIITKMINFANKLNIQTKMK